MNGVTNIILSLPAKQIIPLKGEIDYYGARHILAKYCKASLNNKPLSHIGWAHGWIPDFWNETDPRLVTSQSLEDKEQLILTSKTSIETYLRSCGYKNTYAIGLPIVYLEKRKIKRIKDSLLVMPAHSLDYTTHNHWKFNEYANEIEKIAKYFKHIYICVHPSCFKKGYWVKEFQAKGYNVIEGISVDDKNALYRLQYLMSTFEYVTTNTFGSHIAYAAYFGAKVSIYGSYAEFKEEDFKDDPFYLQNPDILKPALELTCENRIIKELKHLFVLPQEATLYQEWGLYEVGEENKKSPEELSSIFLNITLKEKVEYMFEILKVSSKKILKKILPKQLKEKIDVYIRHIPKNN